MELDRAHLNAGHEPIGVIDINIGLLVAIFFDNPDVMNLVAEASGVMLLEEALPCAALRTPNEADRPTADPGQHDLRHGGVRPLVILDSG
jgi:hypothetical protein